jgi:uncharacterized protein
MPARCTAEQTEGLPGYQQRAILSNTREYGDASRDLRFLSSSEAGTAEKVRKDLLATLPADVRFGCHGTKLDCRDLSTGCQICGSGQWSCLFINGKCNCNCFYCPTEQGRIGVPTTNTIQFPRASDYADYVEKFRFQGVSISGGEPLLSLEACLKYIVAVRKRLGDRLYIWLYTNGILSNPELLARLRDAGLDEIRFDIGAVGYHLEKARQAVGIIPVVTVEIPAIPEDYELVREKLRPMADSGISHLNLHQLRLTPFNLEKVKNRGYTFLHGERVTVLESEWTALRLIRDAAQGGIALPINYCSFHYKRSYQRAAARRKSAPFVMKSYEDLTQSGFIRSLFLKDDAGRIADQAGRIVESGGAPDRFSVSGSGDRLYFSASLLEGVGAACARVVVTYYEPRIVSHITYRHAYAPVALNRRKTVMVEKTGASGEIELADEGLQWLRRLISPAGIPPRELDHGPWEQLLDFEMIRPGLQTYY